MPRFFRPPAASSFLPRMAVAFLLGLCAGFPADAEPFHLTITGHEGATYTGSCTLVMPAGTVRTVRLKGTVPLEQTLEGRRLSCRIHSAGRVNVMVRHVGGMTRVTTSRGTLAATPHPD